MDVIKGCSFLFLSHWLFQTPAYQFRGLLAASCGRRLVGSVV